MVATLTVTDFEHDRHRLNNEIEALASPAGDGPGQRHDAIRHVWLLYRRAMLRGSWAELARAEEALVKLLERIGPQPDLCLLKSMVDLALHRLAAVKRDIEMVPALASSWHGRALRADVDLQEGRYEQARRGYERVRAEALVREELARSDLSRPAGIAGLRFLEACIQEAMRLWPTTPMLVSETVAEAALDGETLPIGTQVLIWNSFNHRDRERYPLADTFCPEARADGRPSPLFNHLSSGPQVCAGIDLLLFIAKAVIATILAGGRYRLVQPVLDPTRPLPYAYNYFDLRLLAG
jgi:hypothetical protein